PELPRDHIVAEPAGRGTAASIGLAATLIAARDPAAGMGSFHADHAIADVAGFPAGLRLAEAVARPGLPLPPGIPATYPETGYGYIKFGESLAQNEALNAYVVDAFVEKPKREVAEEYLRGGTHVWNSGIFIWRVDRILQEIRRHVPAVGEVLAEIGAA